jgi:hypothetical protein
MGEMRQHSLWSQLRLLSCVCAFSSRGNHSLRRFRISQELRSTVHIPESHSDRWECGQMSHAIHSSSWVTGCGGVRFPWASLCQAAPNIPGFFQGAVLS